MDFSGFNGVKIIPSKYWPKHPTRRYTQRFDVHPLILWLSKWLPIVPYIEADFPDDSDPIFSREHNALLCGQRHYALIKAETTQQPKDTE